MKIPTLIAVLCLLARPALAQWVPLSFPEGGNIAGVTAVGTTLVIGTLGRGPFRSTDGGATWTPVDSGSFAGIQDHWIARYTLPN